MASSPRPKARLASGRLDALETGLGSDVTRGRNLLLLSPALQGSPGRLPDRRSATQRNARRQSPLVRLRDARGTGHPKSPKPATHRLGNLWPTSAPALGVTQRGKAKKVPRRRNSRQGVVPMHRLGRPDCPQFPHIPSPPASTTDPFGHYRSRPARLSPLQGWTLGKCRRTPIRSRGRRTSRRSQAPPMTLFGLLAAGQTQAEYRNGPRVPPKSLLVAPSQPPSEPSEAGLDRTGIGRVPTGRPSKSPFPFQSKVLPSIVISTPRLL